MIREILRTIGFESRIRLRQMNSRRRIIDPDREADALDRIPSKLIIPTFGQVEDLHIGRKAETVMAIMDAWAYGAKVPACCEYIGISTRTYERWRVRMVKVLNAFGEAGVR